MADNIMAHSVRASLNHIEPLLEPSVEPGPCIYKFTSAASAGSSPTPAETQEHNEKMVFMEQWHPGYSAQLEKYVAMENALRQNAPYDTEQQWAELRDEAARWIAEAEQKAMRAASNDKYYGFLYGLW